MFKKLFQKKAAPAAEAVPLKDGFSVIPAPTPEGGSYRVAGTIKHEADGVTQTRQFIRADSYESQETAIAATIRKAEQIVTEQGAKLFDGDLNRPL